MRQTSAVSTENEQPLRIQDFERKWRPRLAVKTVDAVSGFPFSSHAAFLEAVKHGQVVLAISRSYRLVGELCVPRDKLECLACAYCGLVLAAGCVVAALLMHDGQMLLSLPVFALCSLFASPSPACSHGCFPGVAALCWYGTGVAVRSPVAWISFLWLPVWMLNSYGSSVAADVTLRAIKESELILVWTLAQGVVSVQPADQVER